MEHTGVLEVLRIGSEWLLSGQGDLDIPDADEMALWVGDIGLDS